MSENDAAKKTTKDIPSPWRQNDQKGVKMGLHVHAGDGPKIIQIHKFTKMGPRDVPGSKRHLKSIQKASKRCPKGVQITTN